MSIFSVQAQVRDAASWSDVARRCEKAGFAALLAADHPGARPSPLLAVAAAAAVTERIALGSYVANAGIREPFLLACDIATLDVLSNGRALIGLGAGHNPGEWLSVGRERPDVASRVQRCIEVAELTRTLLTGSAVDFTSETTTVAAQLTGPLPIQTPVPLVIGGGNSRLLQWAGEHADIVALSGLGRTQPDGYSHAARWSPAQVDTQVGHARTGMDRAEKRPELEALVQFVKVTDDAAAAAQELADELEMSAEDVLACPFTLIGTETEIAASIRDYERRWGITRFVIREDAIAAMERILPLVA